MRSYARRTKMCCLENWFAKCAKHTLFYHSLFAHKIQ